MILPFAHLPPMLSDFIVGQNSEMIESVQALIEGEGEEFSIYLWGDDGVGKSCLLKAVDAHVRQLGRPTYYVVASEMMSHHATSDSMPPPVDGLLIVDDVGQLTESAQISLFDWYNAAARWRNRAILASGDRAPTDLSVREELMTRLAGGLVFRLRPLNEAGKKQALIRRAARHGFNLPEGVADLFLSRLSRSTDSLVAALDDLDAFLLTQQKSLNQRNVHTWLQQRLSSQPSATD